MPDFIKQKDEAFNHDASDFINYAAANGPELGLSPTITGALSTAFTTVWTPAYADHLAKQTAALGATVTKDNARDALEPLMRQAAGIVQKNPDVTDEQRTAMHLTVADTSRTPAAVPTTRPVLMVDTSQRLQHTLNWKDEATPNSKAKPHGVRALELYCYIGPTAPSDPAQLTFCSTENKTPHLEVHDAADANKVAHYMGRWINTRGQHGPWSETVSATIGA